MKIQYQIFSIYFSSVEHGSHILFGSYDYKAFDENADINFFFERIKKINENNTIPVIWKDGSGHLNSINIPLNESSTMDERQSILKIKQ